MLCLITIAMGIVIVTFIDTVTLIVMCDRDFHCHCYCQLKDCGQGRSTLRQIFIAIVAVIVIVGLLVNAIVIAIAVCLLFTYIGLAH